MESTPQVAILTQALTAAAHPPPKQFLFFPRQPAVSCRVLGLVLSTLTTHSTALLHECPHFYPRGSAIRLHHNFISILLIFRRQRHCRFDDVLKLAIFVIVDPEEGALEDCGVDAGGGEIHQAGHVAFPEGVAVDPVEEDEVPVESLEIGTVLVWGLK